MLGRELGRAVLAQEAHGEMAVVGRALRLLVAGGRLPFARQVVELIPVDARRLADQQFGGALQPPVLHLLGPEGRDADLADPDRQARSRPGSRRSWRPVVERPQVPVERKAVHRDARRDGRARPCAARFCTKVGSIGDMPPSTRGRMRVLGPDRLAGQARSSRRTRPSRDRSPGPNGTCCSARSRSSRLRSSDVSPAPDRRRRRTAPRSPARQRNTSVSGWSRMLETRRCAAWRPSRPRSAPTSWSGRRV